jgi:hypothetical protein
MKTFWEVKGFVLGVHLSFNFRDTLDYVKKYSNGSLSSYSRFNNLSLVYGG